MRFIKLNQQYTTELFVKESDQVNEEDEEEEEDREQDESESPRKKFKSTVSQPPICDPADTQFNHIPMQPLFDKFPHKLVLATAPQPLNCLAVLLRWLDQFQTLKHVIMLAAYVYDRAVADEKSSVSLGQLNETLEHFLNDVFGVTQANGYSHAGVEYLLSNGRLVRCMMGVLASREASRSSVEIGRGFGVTGERCGFYSESVKRIEKSISLMSVVDGLMFNLKRLVDSSASGGDASMLAVLLDSVDRVQTLAFAVNST